MMAGSRRAAGYIRNETRRGTKESKHHTRADEIVTSNTVRGKQKERMTRATRGRPRSSRRLTRREPRRLSADLAA